MQHVFTIPLSGPMTTLNTDLISLPELGAVTRTRVSHIRPVHRLKRRAFIALRIFGDKGRIAAWTRTWRGPWHVEIIGSPLTFTHLSRAACLAWEHDLFNQ